MPKIVQGESLVSIQNNFQFSHTDISNLGASEYTIANIYIDISSSVYNAADFLQKCVEELFAAMSSQSNPRRNNFLLRVVLFNHHVKEVHGFKLLDELSKDNYSHISTSVGGGTALYDALINMFDSTQTFATVLANPPNNFTVNNFNFIITDGFDEHSSLTLPKLKATYDSFKRQEDLEASNSYLVGVNVTTSVSNYLQTLMDELNLDSFIAIEKMTEKEAKQLMNFMVSVSQSVSRSLGSGSSQVLTF